MRCELNKTGKNTRAYFCSLNRKLFIAFSSARRKKMHAIRVCEYFRHFFRVIFLSIEWRSFFMCLGKFFSSENWILSRERENLKRNAAYESNQHDLNTLSLLVWIPHKYISECANNMWGDIFFELHYIFPFIFRLPLFSIAFSFSIIRMPEGSQSISLWDSFKRRIFTISRYLIAFEL